MKAGLYINGKPWIEMTVSAPPNPTLRVAFAPRLTVMSMEKEIPATGPTVKTMVFELTQILSKKEARYDLVDLESYDHYIGVAIVKGG